MLSFYYGGLCLDGGIGDRDEGRGAKCDHKWDIRHRKSALFDFKILRSLFGRCIHKWVMQLQTGIASQGAVHFWYVFAML